MQHDVDFTSIIALIAFWLGVLFHRLYGRTQGSLTSFNEGWDACERAHEKTEQELATFEFEKSIRTK